jgi:hypothetical protein
MMRRALPLLLLMVACGDPKDDSGLAPAPDDTAADSCEPIAWYPDADGDGWGDDLGALEACEPPHGHVTQGGDCDDTEAEVHPGAEELCNARDDDCDGVADDGATHDWYLDSDGDGWGDESTWTQACEMPGDGWVEQGGDCDESDPAVHPGAEEVCDGDDDDCDGRPDEGELGDWASDEDGDGWGDPDSIVETCVPPEGWVQQVGDCDPADAAINPDAAEACNEVDDDCDGETDEGFDADGDGWWDASCSHLKHGDCDDADPDLHPQATEVCDDGLDQDCDGYDSTCQYAGSYPLSDAHAWRWSSHATGDAGRIVRSADLDQDGFDDLVTASLYVGGYLGGAWVTHGPIEGDQDFVHDGWFMAGTSSATGGGRSVGLGDVDGDGYPDVGLGAPWGSLPGLYVTHSPITADMILDDADVVLYGDLGTHMGHGSDLADVTGDGIADGLVASYAVSGMAGVAYVVHGPLTTDAYVNDEADFTMQGENPHDYMGRVVTGGTDVDGDGIGDMLVPAPYASIVGYYTGAVYLVHGPPTGTLAAEDAGAKLVGETASSMAGSVVDMADVDGDGYGDVVVGAYGTQIDGVSSGAAYVAYGPISGIWSLGDVDITIYGDGLSNFGTGIDAEDMDGDGRAELLIGANYARGQDDNSGAAYLYYSPAAGSYGASDAQATFLGVSTDDATGQGVAIGDLDGDSRGDIVIGACAESTGATRAGSIYVLYPEFW